jgi:hypothetical protein
LDIALCIVLDGATDVLVLVLLVARMFFKGAARDKEPLVGLVDDYARIV